MTRIVLKTALVVALGLLAGACASVPQGKVGSALKAKTMAHESAVVALPGEANPVSSLAHIEPRNGGHVVLTGQEDEFDPSAIWQKNDEGYIHDQSGIECEEKLMEDLSIDKVLIFDKNGRDVGCNYENTDKALFVTFYATHAPDLSVRDHMAGAYQAVKQRFPNAKSAGMVSLEIGSKDSKEPIESMSYALSLGELNGRPMKTAIWISKAYGWHVKARGTYPEDEEVFATELLIGLLWTSKTLNVIDKFEAESGSGADAD